MPGGAVALRDPVDGRRVVERKLDNEHVSR
jgi:hypothetical protein